MNEKKQIVIEMTGRRPVKINTCNWPKVAEAHGDSFASQDASRHNQAKSQGELDLYHLVVRQHENTQITRFLVYGIFDAAKAWTGNEYASAGELVTSEKELPYAIHRVGERAKIPDRIICDCVNNLEPEEM
jgi:hypothetical protein